MWNGRASVWNEKTRVALNSNICRMLYIPKQITQVESRAHKFETHPYISVSCNFMQLLVSASAGYFKAYFDLYCRLDDILGILQNSVTLEFLDFPNHCLKACGLPDPAWETPMFRSCNCQTKFFGQSTAVFFTRRASLEDQCAMRRLSAAVLCIVVGSLRFDCDVAA